MKIFGWFCCALLLSGLLLVTPVTAVTLGQIDTFEDGTTQNWVINLLGTGSPPAAALPVNVPTGGPAGVDDKYLRLTSLGGGAAGGRLSVINFRSQWEGDYLAAGISAIVMDLNNLGTSDLSLRLLFADPTIGPPTNLAFSTDPVFVPAGSGWTRVKFLINPDDLTAGLGNVQNALANATELRIYHSVNANFPNPVTPIEAVVATLGVDNITAVPLPTSLLLMGSGILALAAGKKKYF